MGFPTIFGSFVSAPCKKAWLTIMSIWYNLNKNTLSLTPICHDKMFSLNFNVISQQITIRTQNKSSGYFQERSLALMFQLLSREEQGTLAQEEAIRPIMPVLYQHHNGKNNFLQKKIFSFNNEKVFLKQGNHENIFLAARKKLSWFSCFNKTF